MKTKARPAHSFTSAAYTQQLGSDLRKTRQEIGNGRINLQVDVILQHRRTRQRTQFFIGNFRIHQIEAFAFDVVRLDGSWRPNTENQEANNTIRRERSTIQGLVTEQVRTTTYKRIV